MAHSFDRGALVLDSFQIPAASLASDLAQEARQRGNNLR